jgi:hypothetical protein
LLHKIVLIPTLLDFHVKQSVFFYLISALRDTIPGDRVLTSASRRNVLQTTLLTTMAKQKTRLSNTPTKQVAPNKKGNNSTGNIDDNTTSTPTRRSRRLNEATKRTARSTTSADTTNNSPQEATTTDSPSGATKRTARSTTSADTTIDSPQEATTTDSPSGAKKRTARSTTTPNQKPNTIRDAKVAMTNAGQKRSHNEVEDADIGLADVAHAVAIASASASTKAGTDAPASASPAESAMTNPEAAPSPRKSDSIKQLSTTSTPLTEKATHKPNPKATPSPRKSAIQVAEALLKRVCATTTISIHPTMIPFFWPMTISNKGNNRRSIRLNIPNVNHNTVTNLKALEIADNICDSPLGTGSSHSQSFGQDMEMFAIWWDKVRRECRNFFSIS